MPKKVFVSYDVRIKSTNTLLSGLSNYTSITNGFTLDRIVSDLNKAKNN